MLRETLDARMARCLHSLGEPWIVALLAASLCRFSKGIQLVVELEHQRLLQRIVELQETFHEARDE